MVYVHVPFCRSFCTYCDFYSEIACKGKDGEAIESYLACVEAEIRTRKAEILATSENNTLYIGGGTPSVLPPDAFGRILSALSSIGVDCRFDEFTVEVNPDDIVGKGEEYVSALMALGVNRISMGVQTLDDGILKWMNRRHNAAQAARALEILRGCGIGNISVDIIFGVSGMTDKILEDSVTEILSWHPEHVSAYQLMIEEGSTLERMASEGLYNELPEEECRAQYEYLCRTMAAAGYCHYEISNWALPGRRAQHNSAYWTRAPYVGIGPGAHSLSGRRRSWNSLQLKDWTSDGEELDDGQILQERLMLGLRTAEGVDGRRIPESDWFIADSIISDII